MLTLYTLDKTTGAPVRCLDWVTWATTDFRLARTEVGTGYVSTIFLGWLAAHRHDDPPRLFETMICGIDGLDFEERYATRAEALTGHARAVEVARRAIVEAAGSDGPQAA